MLVMLTLLLLSTGAKQVSPHLPAPVQLQISSTKDLNSPSFGVFGIAQSDADGNLYFHAATRHYTDSIIHGVYSEKSQPVVFAVPEQSAKNMIFSSFFVTRDGSVYIMVEDNDFKAPPHVFAFDDDGQVKSNTELEVPTGVRPNTLTVFDHSGNMLFSGYYGTTAQPELRGKGYVALVASSGKVLKVLESKINFDLKKIGEDPDQSSAYIAEDGNLYLLNRDEILVVHESGEVIRRLRVRMPKEKDCYATKIVVSQGVVAVWLMMNDGKDDPIAWNFETIDANTGRVIGLYYPADALGNNPVNFTRQDGFTFVDSENGKMRLLIATPR